MLAYISLQKIQQKYSACPEQCQTLQSMVLYEVQNRQHMNSNSATVALLWLKRQVPQRDVVFSSDKFLAVLNGNWWMFQWDVGEGKESLPTVVSLWAQRQPCSLLDHCLAMCLIHRGVEYIREFLWDFLTGIDDLTLAANSAYGKTLKEFHSFVVRGVFAVSAIRAWKW